MKYLKHLTHPATMIGLAAILGVGFGLIVGEWAANIKFIGDLFIRLIQMSIVPLVMGRVLDSGYPNGAFIVPVLCFAYLFALSLKGGRKTA